MASSAPSIIRVVLGVVSMLAALVLIAIGFVLLVADAGRAAGPREMIQPLGVLAGGGGLLALGIGVLVWEMSVRFGIRH